MTLDELRKEAEASEARVPEPDSEPSIWFWIAVTIAGVAAFTAGWWLAGTL